MPAPSQPGTFPSLTIGRDQLAPNGPFAETQARYLEPNAGAVRDLSTRLERANVGVVAHFYMDPELQGTLASCHWPHIHISDSLAMADHAIDMVKAGVERVVVLGVDFMSENVRAMLDASGFESTPVLRVSDRPIGCSLAESAEAPAYGAWLSRAARTPGSVHVVYINTSLRTKAKAQALVPTVTCTSSNVVRLVLQAFAQAPEGHVWFGPDTYMGRNLRELFEQLARMSDGEIRAIHPDHGRDSVAALLERFHYFEEGTCIVHHMFGQEVAQRVEAGYPDAHVTAHLEVPGEMFRLGLAAERAGRGVVGSTSNILAFITEKVRDAARQGEPRTLQFVLGTESGMITSIVRSVQAVLREEDVGNVEAEIVFPVAQETLTPTPDSPLGIVPGAPAGEGCTVAGGCATCPYMKMNSLDALTDVLSLIESGRKSALAPYAPRSYDERIDGQSIATVGELPILAMREFQRTGRLPDSVVHAQSAAE